jgi:GTP cyclohydrolase II
MNKSVPIEFIATSKLPTAFGDFNISVFQDPKRVKNMWRFLKV